MKAGLSDKELSSVNLLFFLSLDKWHKFCAIHLNFKKLEILTHSAKVRNLAPDTWKLIRFTFVDLCRAFQLHGFVTCGCRCCVTTEAFSVEVACSSCVYVRFSPGTQASSHSSKTCMLGESVILDWPQVWLCVVVCGLCTGDLSRVYPCLWAFCPKAARIGSSRPMLPWIGWGKGK